MSFSGKTILVTGASAGIGLATAQWFAKQGAKQLLLVDVDPVALEDLDLPCPCRKFVADVSDPAFWESADLGQIDHAVINAGIARVAKVADCDFEDWRRVLSVNLDGAFLTLRAALRSIGDGGSIVAVASVAGVKAEPGIAAYGSSKAALIHLVRIAAKEVAERNVRVNAIAPGGVETAIWNDDPMFAERISQIGRDAAFAEMAAVATPIGRFEKAEEIARQIAFLLSDASGTMTGAVLVSDGGYSL